MRHKRRLPLLLGLLVALAVTLAACGGGDDEVGRIAFRLGGDVHVINADGTGQSRLTTNSANDIFPAWSPDGSKIAFVSLRDGDRNSNTEIDAYLDIYVMNADGSGQTRLAAGIAETTFDTIFVLDGHPAWSPDGKQIAFISDRDGDLEIYVMNADGSGQTRLTTDSAVSLGFAWSPDGSRIAFTSRGRNWDIYVMNADGTGQRRLTTDAAVDEWPAWSPDGSRITFVSRRDGNSEIYVMNADGSGVTRLTTNSVIDMRPAWSPDGSKISFVSFSDGDVPELCVMKADGSGVTCLTVSGGLHPVWSP